MNDAYVECLVKQVPPQYAPILKIGLILLCAMSLVAAFLYPLGIILLLASVFLTYLIFQNMDLEYEYLYIDGQLTIDRIMGKSKRKTVWDGDMDKVNLVAPYNQHQHNNSGNKSIDCSSRRTEVKRYTLTVLGSQGTTQIIFEPNEEMLQSMRHRYPMKVQI